MLATEVGLRDGPQNGRFHRGVHVVDARQQDRRPNPCWDCPRLTSKAPCDVAGTRGVTGDNDPPGIPAVGIDVVGEPLDDSADILGPSRPWIVRRKPIIHRYTNHAVTDRPTTDMILERKISDLLVSGGVSPTVHKHEHRLRLNTNCADVMNVQSMP
jgi:hypothetical protein